MKSFTIESLVALKKAVASSEKSQQVDVQEAKSYIVEDYLERSKKLRSVKDYIETSIKGITVDISGGSINRDNDDPDFDEYNPIKITTYKYGDKNHFSTANVVGHLLLEENFKEVIFDSYIESLVIGEDVQRGYISTMELYLTELLNDTCLSEGGFSSDNNQLMLFKDEKVYTIIKDITTDVQGVVKLNLPYELDESLIVMCYDRNILISDDFFYIDAE